MGSLQIRPARVNPLLRHENEARTSLDGEWRFALDPDDMGVREQWQVHSEKIDNPIRVPGCWQGQGFGHEATDRVWDFNVEARVFQATYKGVGWYAHRFASPTASEDSRIWLNFGGVHPSATVWLNGKRVGENTMPFVPFAFDITGLVSAAGRENEVVVRVDERNREYGFAYSWMGNWSGLYRGVDLTVTGPCWLTRCAVTPDLETQAIRFQIEIDWAGDEEPGAMVHVRIAPPDAGGAPITAEAAVDDGSIVFSLPVQGALAWTPDTPHLYRVDIALILNDRTCDARSERVGFVEMAADGHLFRIGGQPYYLRGSGDLISCPETGCPDTDRDRWRRKLRTLRDYGYNYVRCQSFVYTPEYLDVADEVGLLVQSEMGILGGWGGHTSEHEYQWPKPTADHYDTLKRQWDLTVERDVCHPSANIYCMSNEYGTTVPFPKTAWRCYHDTKAIKPSAFLIWTDGGLNPAMPSDFINYGSQLIPAAEMEAFDRPFIEHEFQWWSSFPDVRLRPRYDGAVRPYVQEIAEAAAEARGQSHLLATYAANSQHLQYIEAKSKMEILRRDSPTLAGINHFNAADTYLSPQGIIDDFYERKLVDAQTWLETNGDAVVLSSLGFEDRCRLAGDEIHIEFYISDFGHPALTPNGLDWTLSAGDQVFERGRIAFAHKAFTTMRIGEIALTVPVVDRPLAATLEAVVAGGDGREVRNSWSLWLFPNEPPPANVAVHHSEDTPWLRKYVGIPRFEAQTEKPHQVVLTDRLDDELVEFMRSGGRVILAAGEGLVRPHRPLFGHVNYFFTPPANYPPYEDGQNGTVIAAHPMLGDFPHQGFADWQLFRPIDNSPPIDLEPLGLAEGEPVIRVIHRYQTLHPLAHLVERRVGAGVLIISALDLRPEWPEARLLLSRIVAYAGAPNCRPAIELSADSLGRIVRLAR